MQYDWITKEIENGGVLTVSKTISGDGLLAMMAMGDRGLISGEISDTLPEALEALNFAISDEE